MNCEGFSLAREPAPSPSDQANFNYGAAVPVQPAGKNSWAAVEPQLQTPSAERVRVIALPRTGAGAFNKVHAMVPVPAEAVPEAVKVQLLVGDVPPILANDGLVP